MAITKHLESTKYIIYCQRVAVLFVHGMGYPKPMETIKQFARAVLPDITRSEALLLWKPYSKKSKILPQLPLISNR